MIKLDLLGKDAKFEHIGLVVKSIREISGDKAEVHSDSVQKVHVAFVDMHGVRVELIEPMGEASPVAASLNKGQKLLHLCYRVPDLENAIQYSRTKGFHCIARPVPAVAFTGKPIAWLFSKEYGLVELVED
jgi:methylmalonyl-CoA/ethylmalonyl-CoA epimerase